MGSLSFRRILTIALVVVAALLILSALLPDLGDQESVPFGEVVRAAKAGQIQSIDVKGQDLTVTYVGGSEEKPIVRSSRVASNTDVASFLSDQGVALSREGNGTTQSAVELTFSDSSDPLGAWLSVGFSLLPLLFLGLLVFWMFRQGRGMTSQSLAFSKSGAKLFTRTSVTVTFADVAGVDEAKIELAEVVEFLKTPDKFLALGARIPKGVLLLGPPGTGKTLLARAVAGEAGVAFFSISGSEFVEMFVGVGAGRVRDLFAEAKKNSPCIVFIDEIDAVGRQRGTGLGGSHDEREQTLNQILVEMDGFEPDANVVVIAATNRPDILDPALLRPGRFDRKVILDAPDVRGREAILDVHLKGKPVAPDVRVPVLAKSTPGFSGADLANLVNEAAILAARADKKSIGMAEFEEAVDRVIAGPERKSRIMSEHERRLTAYHEAGHTVVAQFMEHHDPPHKVSIVARGMAGGYTRFLAPEESHYRSQEMLLDDLCVMLAGQAAEELIFGQTSTGPSDDLEQATGLARSMITRWGMSERLGPRTFGRREELVFLGREVSETRNFSERTAEEIDDELRRLVESAKARARVVLSVHRPLLDKLADALLEFESLEGEMLSQLLTGAADSPPIDSKLVEVAVDVEGERQDVPA